jgi:hypothetical protein
MGIARSLGWNAHQLELRCHGVRSLCLRRWAIERCKYENGVLRRTVGHNHRNKAIAIGGRRQLASNAGTLVHMPQTNAACDHDGSQKPFGEIHECCSRLSTEVCLET